MKKNCFGYNEKIREKKDFDRLFKLGEKSVSISFFVYVCPNNLDYNRLAISIKRHIAKAVSRNRMKRLVREIFRLNKHFIFEGIKKDILVIVRKDFSKDSYETINEELLQQWQKLSHK